MRNAYKIWLGCLKERDHLEDKDVDGNNITLDLRKIGQEDLDLIHLAQDRDQWRALENAVMNLRVP